MTLSELRQSVLDAGFKNVAFFFNGEQTVCSIENKSENTGDIESSVLAVLKQHSDDLVNKKLDLEKELALINKKLNENK